MMWVALSLRTGMGVIRGRREVHAAGGVEAAWDRWARQHSGEARDIEARVKAMSAWLKARDMAIVGMDDARYPALLLEIPDAPLALYGWGSWPLRSAWSRALAVVGTRTCTAQGQAWAQEIASDWSGSGGRVVSGLARGIDIAAHRGTAKGQAVVVLPCGLDAIHPRIHEAEAACMVASGGLLLTERPPQTSVERWMFAARNRIITGLAPATVVVQSPSRGGSLISAQCALDQNRELYVFHPPTGSPRWSGNRSMVEDGWGDPVRDPTHLWNVMAGLPSAFPGWQRSVPPACRPVWDGLSAKRALRLDELAVELDEAEVRRHVAVLVSLGLVARLPGRRYVRA